MSFLGTSRPSSRVVEHLPLGRSDYGEVLNTQRELQVRRSSGTICDTVLTVEHDPVFTIGRRGSRANLLVSQELLDEEGIGIFDVERGGDITYHGPGQFVVYPIIDLRDYGRDVRAYVDRLEETAIRTLAAFGVVSEREQGRPGVWVDGRKIASVGVSVRRWITCHGLALNVDADRRHFAMIRPCGLPVQAVSMTELVTGAVCVEDVAGVFLDQAAKLFGWTLRCAGREKIERNGDATELD